MMLLAGFRPVSSLKRLHRLLATTESVEIGYGLKGQALQAVQHDTNLHISLYNSSRWSRPRLNRRRRAIRRLYHSALEVMLSEGICRNQVTMHVWGMRDYMSWTPGQTPPWSKGGRVIRYEDGFLRSKNPGSKCEPGLSTVTDDIGMYFNAKQPSRLERLIQETTLEPGSKAYETASQLRDLICSTGVSKYNPKADPEAASRFFSTTRSNVLVLGQLENDQSIHFGCFDIRTNAALAELARAENPDANIVYKPHPAAFKKPALKRSYIDAVAEIADGTIDSSLRLADCFPRADRVYVMSSGAGFESVLHGRPTRVAGVPFYSGWGITDDVDASIRTQRTGKVEKTVLEVLYATYVLYSKYRDPVTGEQLGVEDVIERLT